MQTRLFPALCAVLPLFSLLSMACAAPAHAQDAPPAAADTPPHPETGAPLPHPDTNSLPPEPTPAPPEALPPLPAQATTRDHQQHHWAVGAFSAGNVAMTTIQLQVPYNGQASAPLPYAYSNNISLGPIPAVGARIWLRENSSLDIGLDVGLGFATASEQRRSSPSSAAVGDPNSETRAYDYAPSAVYVHLAAPIVVYQGRRYTMEFIPEVNVGFGWGRGEYQRAETGAAHGLQTDGHGINIDAGVRAGPEITFGYFDLPELVVQPTVGLLVHWDSTFAGSRMGDDRGEALNGHVNVNSAVARLDASVSMFYYF